MAGRRVLVSGMGGELGSLVAAQLEREPWVGRLLGIDVDPPRRRLHRAEFHRLAPSDRDRVVELVGGFDPHLVVHVAVWEPDARAPTDLARRFTAEAATTFLGAAAEAASLEAIVIRSGIEVYGRGRHALTRPDETVATRPTSVYGDMLVALEDVARRTAERRSVPLAALRLAPVLGPHVPSPLGRLLRQPLVPFSALADPAFAVVQDHDAATAFVAAARRSVDGAVNVVAPGAITARHAIRRGGRLAVPLVGPEWALARRASHLVGAPIPHHVLEVLHRGRLADGSAATELLGIRPKVSTAEVIDRLYAWPSIVRVERSTESEAPHLRVVGAA